MKSPFDTVHNFREMIGEDGTLHPLNFQKTQLLTVFASNVPGAVFYYTAFPDGTDTIEFINEYCETIWGITPKEAEIAPERIWDMTHAEDLDALRASVHSSATSLTFWDHCWRLVDENGTQKWLHGRGMPHALPNGSIRWMTFIFEITARIESEARAASAEEQLAVAMEAIPDGFAVFDERSRFVACNNMFREIYKPIDGSIGTEATYQTIIWAGVKSALFCIPNQMVAEWVETQLDRYRRAEGVQEIEFEDGRWFRVLERATPEGGRIVFQIDITVAKTRQKLLEKAALTDNLTGLLNRRGLSEKLAGFKNWLADGERIAFLHFDLDRFKTVNDSLGHEAGDYVLKAISQTLTEHTVMHAGVARVGGDEFVIAWPTTLNDDQVLVEAECLREKVTSPLNFKGRICQVGATVGVSFWCQNGATTFEHSLLNADTALIQGKGFGRNRTVSFTADMRDRAVEAAHIASQIRNGLDAGQFIPYFQPQIEMPSGRLCGLEVLVRWQKENGSIVPASSFIDVANETGLIVDIDNQMLSKGLAALGGLNALGLKDGKISFNFSGAQLGELNLVDKVVQVTNDHGASCDQVCVEVLESTLLDHRSNTTSANIHALAKAGFRIELDDFGTGHTALASLRQFPVHGIKIDRSLITSIDTELSLQAITDGIFSLCRKLEIEVLAEGVETEAELKTLTDMGISAFQGYLLARPMSYADLVDFMRKRGDLA
jgi:diguanylate cyclase (GGDEF)-like protein